MRTVKASEVVKGMRVEVTTEDKGVEHRVRGEVREVDTVTESTWITFVDNRSEEMHANHPVTVLAEPEPEWVEGAWYLTRHRGGGEKLTVRKRGKCGWVTAGQAEAATYLVPDEAIEAFGRVLIVDWPGDDVARTLEHWPNGSAPLTEIDKAVYGVADAIRTQGGAR